MSVNINTLQKSIINLTNYAFKYQLPTIEQMKNTIQKINYVTDGLFSIVTQNKEYFLLKIDDSGSITDELDLFVYDLNKDDLTCNIIGTLSKTPEIKIFDNNDIFRFPSYLVDNTNKTIYKIKHLSSDTFSNKTISITGITDTTIELPNTLDYLEPKTFYNTIFGDNILQIVCDVPILKDYSFSNMKPLHSLFTITLNNTKQFGENIFSNITNINKILITNNICSIIPSNFIENTSVKTLSLSTNISELSEKAFYNSNIENLIIPFYIKTNKNCFLDMNLHIEKNPGLWTFIHQENDLLLNNNQHLMLNDKQNIKNITGYDNNMKTEFVIDDIYLTSYLITNNIPNCTEKN